MVEVIGDYFIDNNDNCYTAKLDKHKVTVDKKTGSEIPVYEIVGYYSTFLNAVNGIREHMIANKLAKKTHSLKEAIAELKQINKEFKKILEEG